MLLKKGQVFFLIFWCQFESVPAKMREFENINPKYRPIPAVDTDLTMIGLAPRLDIRWCTTVDCKKVFAKELDGIESGITIVIDDIQDLFDSRKYGEQIGMGCARMNYASVLVRWDRFQSSYYQAVSNSHGVAKQILEYIIKSRTEVHLIGLGIGAHVAGFIGKRLKNANRISRITALDPTRILYEYNEGNPDLHLDRNDADFVDVYHTDYKGKMRVGYIYGIGTVDFYQIGGLTKCRGVVDPPGDSLKIWKRPYSSLVRELDVCKHNFAALNFISGMHRNCTMYGVRNMKDMCTKDNCIPIGFMASAFMKTRGAGGDKGNYVYNGSTCYVGVPDSTDPIFAEVFRKFGSGKHPLIDDRGWIEWAKDEAMTGIPMVTNTIWGIWDWVGLG